MMVSVFDIAAEFVERAGGKIESVKLQKMCFYAFGWYAHLTGTPLFGEQFYAMKYGPVVGQLLSTHAGHKEVDQKMLDTQFEAWDTQREEVSGYIKGVIDSVWETYGQRGAFDLAEYSHGEVVWEESWQSKPEGAKRGEMQQDSIISYFLEREPREGEVQDLPPALLTRIRPECIELAESDCAVHLPFIQRIKELQSV